ncbi:MAG: M20/M25/M40 family metallo-hydrolase [Alphaproteobacteria bacterium]
MKFPRLLLAPLAAALVGAAPQSQPALSAAADRVRADVEFLASDLLEGRETGSRGHEIAAAYVAAQFRSMGLKPGGTGGGWYVQVPLREAAHADAPSASLSIGRRSTRLRPGTDIGIRPSLTRETRRIDAPLVFAGHGISDRRLGIDDYSALDVRGRVVVVLDGTPPGLPSEIEAHLDSSKAATAAEKGAAGLIEIADTAGRKRGKGVASFGQPVIDWVDPSGKSASQSSRLGLFALLSRSAGERLFAASGRSLARAIEEGRRPGAMRGFDLAGRIRIDDRMRWRDFSSPEVVGLLPGSDPKLRGEYVVLMGHLDHIGVKEDARPGQDRIYNGALDNAAGVATLLETARTFVSSGKPPRRSVLFIANTAEEVGLRGADYFAANPTVPRQSIVAAVDLDMPVLLYEFTDVIAFGGEHSTVAYHIAEAARAMRVTLSGDPMPEEAIFVRSDHYRFVTRGIPAILLMTGYANGGEKKWEEFFARTYHKPSDDVRQPIRWDQGARYAELNYRIARALADADSRPLWYEGDYFGDTFAPGQPKAPRQASQRP